MTPTNYRLQSLQRFETWLTQSGYSGYDLYDLWASSYGKWAKAIYHRNAKLGAPLVAPVFLADMLLPSLRRIIAPKRRYATADAHFILAFLLRYDASGDNSYLQRAEELAQDLLDNAISGYSGLCWGYPFDWQTNRGLWKKGTPFITVTPYVFRALLALYRQTGKHHYAGACRSIAQFALRDLNETRLADGTMASSYSPIDTTAVVNANSYRALILVLAAQLDGDKQLAQAAEANIGFVLAAQRDNGSWLYDVQNPQDAFVDNIHTCFVLKNLAKINAVLQRPEIDQAIQRGYDYYLANLLDEQGLPRPFAETTRAQLVRREIYDFAEGISLGVLLRHSHPQAWQTACRLADVLVGKYQNRDGSFVTREIIGSKKIRMPYIRWPQAQVYFALSKLLLESKDDGFIMDDL